MYVYIIYVSIYIYIYIERERERDVYIYIYIYIHTYYRESSCKSAKSAICKCLRYVSCWVIIKGGCSRRGVQWIRVALCSKLVYNII